MEIVNIDILCESPDLMPVRATPGAAAFDLRAAHEAEVWQGDTVLIKTGVRLALPPGYVGKVCSRSGLALKEGSSSSTHPESSVNHPRLKSGACEDPQAKRVQRDKTVD